MCFSIKQFCCCSLKTGMLYVSIIYTLYFGIFSYRFNTLPPLVPANSLELYASSWYWYGGFCVSGLALLAVLWEKRVLLLPLMAFEVFVFSLRVITLWEMTFDPLPNRSREYEGEVLLLPLQLFMMAHEFSYYRESANANVLLQTRVVCLPVGTNVAPSAPCIVDVPVRSQFTDTPYPVEYGVQSPYVKPSWNNSTHAPAMPQVYPPFPVMPGGQVTLEPILRTQQPPPPLQPFPHGAPPPYTENPPPYAPPL